MTPVLIKTKISVIMPVYNAGVFLKDSINDLMHQAFDDYALVCIDDCSEDRITKEVLQDIQNKEPKVHVIFLDRHLGAAGARNYGLNVIKSDFVIFVDADDRFDSNYLKDMYNSITESNADIAVCGHDFMVEDGDGVFRISDSCIPKIKKGVTDRVFCLKELDEDGLGYWTTNPWNKICRRSFIEHNELAFLSMPSGNDMYWSLMCAICAERIIYCRMGTPLVHYRIGISNQISANRDSYSSYIAINRIKNEYKSEMSEELDKQLKWLLVTSSVNEVRNPKGKNQREYYNYIRKVIERDRIQEILDDRKAKKYAEWILELEFDTLWFTLIGDFYKQLIVNSEPLLNAISNRKRIVIWGMGKRGRAFEKFCNENDLRVYLYDELNENIMSLYNFDMIKKNELDFKEDLVVASNEEIFAMLEKEYYGVDLLNLQRFCPYE